MSHDETNGFDETLDRCGLREITCNTGHEILANCYYEVALERGFEVKREEITPGGKLRYVVTFWAPCSETTGVEVEAVSRAAKRIKESKPCWKQ